MTTLAANPGAANGSPTPNWQDLLWPPLTLDAQGRGAWSFGPASTLRLQRESPGLSVGWPGEKTPELFLGADLGPDPTRPHLRLRWALADSPLVFYPAEPWRLLPRDEQVLYLGLPLWLRLELPDGRSLGERCLERLPTTFLGKNAHQGQVLPAWKGPWEVSRPQPSDLPRYLAKARLTLRNPSARISFFTRLVLPMETLELYFDAALGLFTNDLLLDQADDEGTGHPRGLNGPPSEAPTGRLESSPRQNPSRRQLARVFSDFLS